MRIGELAERSGVSERMLRYYEQEGLLRPERTASGYRNYSPTDIKKIERIRLLTTTGLKIESIRVILPCMMGEKEIFEPCPVVKTILEQELKKLNARLNEFTQSKLMVESFLHGVTAEIEN